ncbi:hypothetical protein JCM10908_002436 [Rhodotorula pacifica]|uniref:Zn(II)2Cys6 transcription factor domain-containing protein n=1 Tax=Rhodotorula pacifica TaxID=1495444 RepID=UPI0031808755
MQAGQETLQKRKKPPACDRCKAKRVLCHPDPQGCPRCREKGFLYDSCTTTPPARRGRPKRDAAAAAAAPVQTSAAATTADGTFPQAHSFPDSFQPAQSGLPVPPPLAPPPVFQQSPSYPSPTPIMASRPAQILSFASAGPSSNSDLRAPPPLSNASLSPFATAIPSAYDAKLGGSSTTAVQTWQAAPYFRTDASTSNCTGSVYAEATTRPPAHQIDALAKRVSTGAPMLNPELSRHLYEAFRQSPHFDEGLVLMSSLLPMLTLSNWQVDRLPLANQALAYSAFTIGTLYSYDSSIIGSSHISSFADLAVGQDLRAYGKKRRPAFEQMRDLALRAAKEVDVWMEPTVDNAATCSLLDISTRVDEIMSLDSRRTRPFHRAYVSHLSYLVENDAIPCSYEQHGPAIRTIHLAGDICGDIGMGMVTSSFEEQRIITGSDQIPSAAEVEKAYKAALAAPLRDMWPDVHPICLVYISTARAMVNDLFAPHRRKAPVDVAAFTRHFHAILELQNLASLHARVWDRIIAKATASATAPDGKNPSGAYTLFPHLVRRKVRWSPLLAAQAIGRFGSYMWATLVVPFISELTRRVSAMESPSAGTSPASSTSATKTFAQEHEQAQLHLLLRQARALVPLVVEVQFKLFKESPSLALIGLSKPIGMAETFELWLDLIESGHVVANAALAAAAAESVRLGGWVYSNRRLDILVDRLDSIAASCTGGGGPEAYTHLGAPSSNKDAFETWTAQLFEMISPDEALSAANTPAPPAPAPAVPPPSLADFLGGDIESALPTEMVDSFTYLQEASLAFEAVAAEHGAEFVTGGHGKQEQGQELADGMWAGGWEAQQ